jgi:hypothetical protein
MWVQNMRNGGQAQGSTVGVVNFYRHGVNEEISGHCGKHFVFVAEEKRKKGKGKVRSEGERRMCDLIQNIQSASHW